VADSGSVRIRVKGLGTVHILFVKPESVSGALDISVTKVKPDPWWSLFFDTSVQEHGSPWVYDGFCNGTCHRSINGLGSERMALGALLRSNSPRDEEFDLSAHFKLSDESGLEAGVIAGLVVIGVCVVVVAMILFRRRRIGNDSIHEPLADEEPSVRP
jgi:hypothetical protein